MSHTPINTGAGWACLKCKRAWDQGEAEPEDCSPDEYPFNTVEGGVRAIYDGERALPPELDQPPLPAAVESVKCGRVLAQEFAKTDPMAVQHGGSHYKSLAIQPTEFCMKNGLDFCIGSILKYVTRHRSKNGIEDLRKARHFVEIRESFPYHIRQPGRIEITMLEYVTRNSIRPDDAEVLYRLEAYCNAQTYNNQIAAADRVVRQIDTLIATTY